MTEIKEPQQPAVGRGWRAALLRRTRARRRHAVQEVNRAVDAAALLDVKYLVIHPGPERSDIPRSERPQRMDHAADSLNRIAGHCRGKNVGLVLENMLPHLFTGPVRELIWILVR